MIKNTYKDNKNGTITIFTNPKNKYGYLPILIDKKNLEKIKNYTWCIHKESNNFYAVTSIYKNGKHVVISMHVLIKGTKKGKEIDHIKHYKEYVNNKEDNLRHTNHFENIRNTTKYKNNTSGFKGVSKFRVKNKYGTIYIYWRAQIKFNNKLIYLGYFKTAELAYQAYCKAAKKYHGKFACF
jgi:hypothetical protein